MMHGAFSKPSVRLCCSPVRLVLYFPTEHIIYVIIAVVLGGMLLVVMVIMTALLLAVCRRRCNRGRKIGERVCVIMCVKEKVCACVVYM